MNIKTHRGSGSPKLAQEERFRMLLDAPKGVVSKIDSLLMNESDYSLETESPSRLVTVSEAARSLNISRPTIYRLISQGVLPVLDIGLSSNRIREADLLKLSSLGVKNSPLNQGVRN